MTTRPGVDALLDAYADRGRAIHRVRDLIARHANEVAADPLLVLDALDCHSQAIGWCPSGCLGDCTPRRARDRGAGFPARCQ